MKYREQTIETLKKELKIEKDIYDTVLKEGINIDISRGKPCSEQLDLSNELLTILKDCALPTGPADVRNYGGLQGVLPMREIFADLLGVKVSQVMAGDNSSLNMMYDTVQRCMQFGVMGSTPWNKLEKVKFICPSPGYDRHFTVTSAFGIELITVPMDNDGPIMDVIESLVKSDDSIKGIWCVPKYSNPTGVTYSDAVVDRLASMECAASDFRIFWDNAYAVHDLYDESTPLKNIYDTCDNAGNPNRVYMFTSTSKITLPGAGVACFASSDANIKDVLDIIKYQTIGPNKVNQFAHAQFLGNADGVRSIMKKHADIIRPKFQAILNVLEDEFGGSDIASWSKPLGGYFISYDVMNGCAKRVYELCKNAGLVITTVGDTFPYGRDDKDSNIRIAPTFTNTNELDKACKILVCSTKIACIEKIMADK